MAIYGRLDTIKGEIEAQQEAAAVQRKRAEDARRDVESGSFFSRERVEDFLNQPDYRSAGITIEKLERLGYDGTGKLP